MLRFKKAFSLVELVVVIAILAILAITSFVVLSQWFVKSRNIKRISDLQGLKTALNSYYYSNFKYPRPWESIEIRDENDEVIWYQWLFDESVGAKMREVTKVPKDPLDKGYYGYSILVKNWVWYELVSFLEVIDTNLLGKLDNAYAISLSSRVPYVIWEYEERWGFHLKPLTFIHPDYGVITSNILWSWWYVKIDSTTLTGYESSGGVIWGVNVWWGEYWVAEVIGVGGVNAGSINKEEISQALPVVGGVSSNKSKGLSDDDLIAMFELWSKYTTTWRYGCDIDNMVVNRNNFSWWKILNYSLSSNTIYFVPNGIYSLTGPILINGKCIWLIGENKDLVVFSGSPWNWIELNNWKNILSSFSVRNSKKSWIFASIIGSSYVGNIDLSNNNYWLSWRSMSNSKVENIRAFNNLLDWFNLSFTSEWGLYNKNMVFKNIKLFNNGRHGFFYKAKPGRENNVFEEIEAYNNWGEWIYQACYRVQDEGSGEKLRNIKAYDNWASGIKIMGCKWKNNLDMSFLELYGNGENGLFLRQWWW